MKAKRIIAIILAVVLLFGNALSVNAVGIIGEMITELPGMNRLTISATLNNYFNSREVFLLNQADTIDAQFAGTADETAHKEKYTLETIVFVDSAISIGDIIAGDIYADADVTETVTYQKDGVTNTATVAHKLLLGLNADNEPTVVYDSYYEAFSGFRSCAYVDETETATTNVAGGSASCIVEKAKSQLGYTQEANGYTIYGAWYSQLDAANGVNFAYSAWCVMFVVWCAAHVNVSESIIGHYANQIYMQDFFIDQGRYHSRTAAVGDWAPATGDLVFFADNRVDASHIGIVECVDETYIYVIHGNNSHGEVASMKVRRTNDWILGYAKPAYASNGHTNKLTRDFNTTQHWHSCANCGCVDDDSIGTHSPELEYDFGDNTHWINCIGCAHKYTNEAHAFTYSVNATRHQGTCATCGYVGIWEEHDTTGYDADETYHWEFCSICKQKIGIAKHTYEMMTGNLYVCSVCCYQTNSPWGGNEVDEELQ